jgi:hypothetical protein
MLSKALKSWSLAQRMPSNYQSADQTQERVRIATLHQFYKRCSRFDPSRNPDRLGKHVEKYPMPQWLFHQYIILRDENRPGDMNMGCGSASACA